MADFGMVDKCSDAALQIRRDIIDMTYATGNTGAHLGGSLSMAEMLSALYVGRLRYNNENTEWEERDRVILSKGHAALALYPAMVQAGILEREQLDEFKKNGSLLSGHPSLNGLRGIEFASGSLGQGLSLGVGVCLALKRKNNDKSRVFVFMGDGECDEGSVWEAAASASHFGLNRLVAIIDTNGIQYDGETDAVLNMSPMGEKWKSFGWDVIELDGHNVEALIDAYDMKNDKPFVIIAKTVKGKGISYMENNWRFHNSRLSKMQYEQAIEELETIL
ncbi:transketolase [Acetatifactor muris]|uniref:Transketolase 2 n=1 Tax=Acetatifactor muris TaxID=879566 RepID=A0A2K4ZA72_9FIRM|nr:transketolase [Acetatifactor muris]MCR2047463.1 transketolase [Acetatifactor muris]SOY27358.1 Transketolase 2 [Acetatifactor muris]